MKITKVDLVPFQFTPEQLPVIENLIERIEALESKGGGKFKKPTVMEVQMDMADKGCQNYMHEAAEFVNYFEQVGWKVGKTQKPMKSWPAAVNNWLKNNYSKPAPEVKQAKVNAMRNIHDTSW